MLATLTGRHMAGKHQYRNLPERFRSALQRVKGKVFADCRPPNRHRSLLQVTAKDKDHTLNFFPPLDRTHMRMFSHDGISKSMLIMICGRWMVHHICPFICACGFWNSNFPLDVLIQAACWLAAWIRARNPRISLDRQTGWRSIAEGAFQKIIPTYK
eukprot:766649-Rhodomonas_salina.1